ncbi:MAG: sugar phosphate isomerase/epimerase family protein [Thermodesulfobacteriota bacterium]|nr:sugar phosphate isomerase/epimerase family protein [Thermodesulfobacteriota bacterium]
MIFGYSTNAFVKHTLIEAIEKISRLGFKGVEIMCDRPHLYPPDFDDPALDQVKTALNTYRLKITNLNSFTLFAVGDTYLPSWIEPEAERRQIRIDHTLACLKLARTLGCGNISIPPGGPLPENMSREEALSLFYQGLERVIPTAEALEVKLLVEPEPDLLLERTSEFKPFIEEIRSPMVGLNFDIGHFYCAGENPAVAFEMLFPWIGHVHIEDIAPTRRHNHLIAGEGAIDFVEIFQTMEKLGYQGDISLELYPYVDQPEAAGRESLDYLMPILHHTGFAVDVLLKTP